MKTVIHKSKGNKIELTITSVDGVDKILFRFDRTVSDPANEQNVLIASSFESFLTPDEAANLVKVITAEVDKIVEAKDLV